MDGVHKGVNKGPGDEMDLKDIWDSGKKKKLLPMAIHLNLTEDVRKIADGELLGE